PGLSGRQAKLTPQPVDGLVHDKVRDIGRHVIFGCDRVTPSCPPIGGAASFSLCPLSRALLICAKYLRVEAISQFGRLRPNRRDDFEVNDCPRSLSRSSLLIVAQLRYHHVRDVNDAVSPYG